MPKEQIIQVRDLKKSFPGVQALKGVSFSIEKGSCHCVVGANGAGKSTFIKILTGAYQKSSGEILFEGSPFSPGSIKEAMNRGISVLYQELNVVDDLSVEENLTLGKENIRFGLVRKNADMAKVEEILKGLDDSISLSLKVGDLSVAQKQVIEIAKAVSSDCRVLVMDEPTAALSEEEVRRLFLVVEKLKRTGMTILFISHKFSEIFEIGDNITVFRDGLMIETKRVGQIMEECGSSVGDACVELVRMMLGKVVVENYIPSPVDPAVKLLEAVDICNGKLKGVSFDLHKGEILGFYGLIGAGKTEVARVLYGMDPYEGTLRICGKTQNKRGIRAALKAGVSLVPEERRTDGIFGKLPIRMNIPMMKIDRVLSRRLINRKKENLLADKYIKSLSLAARDREQAVAYLSGGNQQKVVIAKCLNCESPVILMDEPTRGVDVGAKKEIHDIIRELTAEGKSVIVFSSELPEIIQLCDRIVVMHEGRAREILSNGPGLDSDTVMAAAAGGKQS